MGAQLTDALKLLDAGLSVIPCDPKTKRPAPAVGQWGRFQKVRPTKEEIESLFVNGYAIAVVGGTVSGNLEVIDFDEEGLAKQWRDLLISWNCRPLYDKLIIEESQTKGRFHIIYRHAGKPEGNQKLAMTADGVNRIETRGEGGYCIVSPSRGYKMVRGNWTTIPVISAEEREALLAAARTFDLSPPKLEKPAYDQETVWGDYNARASIDEILVPLGWTRSGKDLWTRPGKEKGMGHSATWNYQGRGLFHVFSSSAGLECRSYDLFGLYAYTHHGGDFKAATLAAAKSGYGKTAAYNPPKTVGQSARKLLCLDDVEAETIEWLVEPYFPLGVGYTMLYGDSDYGKSTVVLALISGWSNGICPVTKKEMEPVKSIILSAEDSAQHVVKPRLLQLGANMRNVFAPEEFKEEGGVLVPDPMTLDEWGAEELHGMVREVGAKVVVIDPLTTYFDGESINDRQCARTWTRRITNLAIAENCLPIVIHHVSKSTGTQGRYRAAGSQDFFDASRSALMAVRGSEDGTDYALSHEKHNYSWRGESIGYGFSKDDGFQWTGASDLTADIAAMRQQEHVEPKKVGACREWILEQLERGPMLSSDLKDGAKAEGWTYITFKRAKDDLRAQIRSWKGPGREDPWWNELRTLVTYDA